jgi:DNA-binding NarL/FixJ family response regulator
VSHQVAGDRILAAQSVFAALAESYESILAEVSAHQSPEPDPDYCPLCGKPLGESSPMSADLLLRATLPEHLAAALMRTPSLSPREQAVFELLGLGYDNRSLARALDVSERTAKRHVTAILAKLGLESRLQAGLAALLTASLRPGINGDPGPKVSWTDSSTTDDT